MCFLEGPGRGGRLACTAPLPNPDKSHPTKKTPAQSVFGGPFYKGFGTVLARTSRMTVCAKQPLLFPDLGARKVVADFSAGDLSSDGGVLLLRQVDHGLGISAPWPRVFAMRATPASSSIRSPSFWPSACMGWPSGGRISMTTPFSATIRCWPRRVTSRIQAGSVRPGPRASHRPRGRPGRALHAQPLGSFYQQNHPWPQTAARSGGRRRLPAHTGHALFAQTRAGSGARFGCDGPPVARPAGGPPFQRLSARLATTRVSW